MGVGSRHQREMRRQESASVGVKFGCGGEKLGVRRGQGGKQVNEGLGLFRMEWDGLSGRSTRICRVRIR